MLRCFLAGAVALLALGCISKNLFADGAVFGGSRLYRDPKGLAVLYGGEPQAQATADAALREWFSRNAARLSLNPTSLRVRPQGVWETEQLITHVFDQYLDGLKVEDASLRLVVRKEGNQAYRVVLAQARLANQALPAAGRGISSKSAVDHLLKDPLYADLTLGGVEAAVVYQNEDGLLPEPRRAWKVQLGNQRVAAPILETIFVDQVSGKILHTRSEVVYHNYSGHVHSYGLPGLDPFMDTNSFVLKPVSEAFVSAFGNDYQVDITDLEGRYSIDLPDERATVEASILSGLFNLWDYMVEPTQVRLRQDAYPGNDTNFIFNIEQNEQQTTNFEVFNSLNIVQAYIRERYLSFPGIWSQLLVRANINAQCNAYFSPGSVNFYRAGDRCFNAGHSTIVAHEYGHHLIHSLGLGQGSFGEGFADSLAMFTFNTDTVGKNFFRDGRNLRQPHDAYVKYPCAGGAHYCGQTLSSVWWEFKKSMEQGMGSSGGEVARRLHLRWLLLTSGGLGNDSAHPSTALEILTADDDDGDIFNGTPHALQICRAFARNGIHCPQIGNLHLEQTLELEIATQPSRNHEASISFSGSPFQGIKPKARVYYKEPNSNIWAFKEAQINRNDLTFIIPGADCGTEFEYYIEISSGSRYRATFPELGPESPARLFFVSSMRLLGNYRFGNDGTLWEVDNSRATQSGWAMTPPINDFIGPYEDTDGSGQYWASTNGTYPQFLGTATLVSPPFPLIPNRVVTIEFDMLARHRFPIDQDFDFYQFDDRLVPITTPLDLGDTAVTWQPRTIKLDPSATSVDGYGRVGFRIRNETNGSIFRVALDHVRIRETSCSNALCPADFNEDGQVDERDMADFLRYYHLGSDPRADFNGDGVVNQLDLFEYIDAYNRGC